MNPPYAFLLSSKRSSGSPAIVEKEKHFASTVKQRSIKADPERSQDKAPWKHTHKPTPQHHQPKTSTNRREEPFYHTQHEQARS